MSFDNFAFTFNAPVMTRVTQHWHVTYPEQPEEPPNRLFFILFYVHSFNRRALRLFVTKYLVKKYFLVSYCKRNIIGSVKLTLTALPP